MKPPRRLSPADAVELLRVTGMTEMAAAAALTAAMHDGSCQLWCDGRPVPSHFAITLAVVIDDRTGAVGITSLTREPWDKPRDAYDWRFDARQVRALPPAEPRDLAPDVSPRRKPGPRATKDWPTHVARELIRRARAGEDMPTAPEMLQFCEDTLGWQPDIRSMQKQLHKLLG